MTSIVKHARLLLTQPVDPEERLRRREERALQARMARLAKEALAEQARRADPLGALDRAAQELERTASIIQKRRALGEMSRDEAVALAEAQTKWATALIEGRIR